MSCPGGALIEEIVLSRASNRTGSRARGDINRQFFSKSPCRRDADAQRVVRAMSQLECH
jgi:hypothetical protein